MMMTTQKKKIEEICGDDGIWMEKVQEKEGDDRVGVL